VTARSAKFNAIDISATMCLAQARAALWLLAQFGGLGSKARKGFGSVLLTEDAQPQTLNGCCKDAAALRELCRTATRATPPESDAIDAMRALSQKVAKADYLEIKTSWKNPCFALDQIGAALQSFAQANVKTGHGKHCESKLALGLPRQIHGPLDFKLPHQKSHTPPKQLVGPKGDRHASPVHFHIARNPDDSLVIRVAAFPAPHLPNFKESEQLLEQLLKHMHGELEARTNEYKNRGQKGPVAPAGLAGSKLGAPASQFKPSLPKAGDMVEAVLLEERTKKGGWRAKHVATGIAGPIQNSADVPADKKVGEPLTLRVQSANEREIAYRFLTTADQAKKKTGGKK
jgi:hypothetical protein